jgi:hypothetical protein
VDPPVHPQLRSTNNGHFLTTQPAWRDRTTDVEHPDSQVSRTALPSSHHRDPRRNQLTHPARRWRAWPLAVLLGFPVGGYLANLIVGPVDSVGAALVGGLIAAAVVGAAQGLALRRLVSWLWIAATTIGMSAGLALGASLVDYAIGPIDLMLMGAITGAFVGGLQAVVLKREHIWGAAWWAVVNPPAWALAWLVSSYVISANIDERFTNFGASGCLLFALLTGLLLELLLRSTEAPAQTP